MRFRMSRMNIPVLLLFLAFIQVMIYSSSVPLWQGPDEPQHYGYVEQWVLEGYIPDMREAFLSKEIVSSFDYTDFTAILTGHQPKASDPTFETHYARSDEWNWIAQHPPLYYGLSAIAYLSFSDLDIIERAFLMRLLSVILYLLTIYFTWKISQEVFPNDLFIQIMTLMFLTFQPMLTFIGSVINNDNLSILLGTLTIYVLAKSLKEQELKIARVLQLAFLCALGALTKYTFLPIIGSVLIILLVKFFKKQSTYRPKLRKILVVTFLTGIIAGWWYVRNLLLYGEVLADQYTIRAISVTAFTKFTLLEFISTYLHYIVQTFWANFGWLYLPVHSAIYEVFLILSLLALIGLLLHFYWKLRAKEFTNYVKDRFLIMMALTIVAQATAVTYYVYDFFIKSGGQITIIQGRYLFPAISAIGISFAFGLRTLFSGRFQKYAKAGLLIFSLALILSSSISLFIYVIPRYYSLTNEADVLSLECLLKNLTIDKPFFYTESFYLALFISYITFATLLVYMLIEMGKNFSVPPPLHNHSVPGLYD